MNRISIVLFFLLSILKLSGQNKDCFKEIEKEDWGITVCIDSSMGVNTIDGLLIHKFYGDVYHSLTLDYKLNKHNLNSRELWENRFGQILTMLPHEELSDTTYNDENIEVYYNHSTFVSDGEKLYFTTGVIKNDGVYYDLVVQNDSIDSYNFIHYLIPRLKFKTIENSSKQSDRLKRLEMFIENNISNKDSLISHSISLDKILKSSDISASMIDEILEDKEPFIDLLDKWNESLINLSKEFSQFKSIEMINVDHKFDGSMEGMPNYTSTFLFKCDNIKKIVKIISFDSKEYSLLGKAVILNN